MALPNRRLGAAAAGCTDGADYNGKDVIEIPASAFKVEITAFKVEGATKWSDPEDLPTSFREVGEYKFSILDADDEDNYAISEVTEVPFLITVKGVYVDVPSDAWYADGVYAVFQNGWITGCSNGMFGPNDLVTRQQLTTSSLASSPPA